MADVTLSDFKNQVLIDLRIYAPGESISTDHISLVERYLNDIFGELDYDNVIDWVTTASVPENRARHLREVVMNRVGVVFGIPADYEKESFHISMLRSLRTPVAAV